MKHFSDEFPYIKLTFAVCKVMEAVKCAIVSNVPFYLFKGEIQLHCLTIYLTIFF